MSSEMSILLIRLDLWYCVKWQVRFYDWYAPLVYLHRKKYVSKCLTSFLFLNRKMSLMTHCRNQLCHYISESTVTIPQEDGKHTDGRVSTKVSSEDHRPTPSYDGKTPKDVHICKCWRLTSVPVPSTIGTRPLFRKNSLFVNSFFTQTL